MITGIGSVSVLVDDAQRSAEWYRDKLGFEIVEDKKHTVFVRPNGSQMLLHLCGPCDAWGNDHPGGRTGIWLNCGEIVMRRDQKSGILIPVSNGDGVEKTYVELKRQGVEFSEELSSTNWGKYAVFKDLDGNEFEIS